MRLYPFYQSSGTLTILNHLIYLKINCQCMKADVFQILEVSYFNDKVERFDCEDSVLSAVKELQHYGVVRQQLNKS